MPLTVEPRDFGLWSDNEPDLPIFGPPDEGQGTGDNQALVRAAGTVTANVLAGEHGPARNATLLGASADPQGRRPLPHARRRRLARHRGLDAGEASAVLERLKALG